MWKKQKLCFFSNDKQADDNFNALLIKENIEYYVLEILSTTLTDFYNKKTSRKLHIYCRNDIPDILIGNRFLATFSKDVNQRSSFVSTAKKVKEKEQGVLVMAFGCNGEKYDRFDLTLPIKSKIRRTGETVVVETPTLRLDITLNCEGYSDVWPAGFEKYYLNNEFFETFAYRVDITVDVRFKFWKSFFNKNTETHQWVDKFITRLYDSTDISEFYRRINWEGNLFVLSKLLSKSKV